MKGKYFKSLKQSKNFVNSELNNSLLKVLCVNKQLGVNFSQKVFLGSMMRFYNSSFSKISNVCFLTNRGSGIFSVFKLSQMVLSSFFLNGFFTGMSRGMWWISFIVLMVLLCDMFSRMSVGYMASSHEVIICYSKFCISVINFLLKNNYISGYEVIDSSKVRIYLSYFNGVPVIRYMKMMSKPSHYRYVSYSVLLSKYSGSFMVLSTKIGMMTRETALLYRIGGILLFFVE